MTIVRKGAGLRPVADAGRVRRPPVVQTGDKPVAHSPVPNRSIEPGTIPRPRGRAGSGRR